jgi:hypothetical protein
VIANNSRETDHKYSVTQELIIFGRDPVNLSIYATVQPAKDVRWSQACSDIVEISCILPGHGREAGREDETVK